MYIILDLETNQQPPDGSQGLLHQLRISDKGKAVVRYTIEKTSCGCNFINNHTSFKPERKSCRRNYSSTLQEKLFHKELYLAPS